MSFIERFHCIVFLLSCMYCTCPQDMDAKYRSFLEELKVLQEQVLDEMLDGWKAKQKSFKTDDTVQQKALNLIQKW